MIRSMGTLRHCAQMIGLVKTEKIFSHANEQEALDPLI